MQIAALSHRTGIMVHAFSLSLWPMVRQIAAICCVVGLAACSPKQDRQFSGDSPLIVSLNPCLDAIVVAVADGDQVLALSHYSLNPAASSIAPEIAGRYTVIGGTAEEVLALDPDIVLASTFIAPATRAAFEQLGITVETFGSPATIEESFEQIRRVGTLTGKDEAAQTLVAKIRESLP